MFVPLRAGGSGVLTCRSPQQWRYNICWNRPRDLRRQWGGAYRFHARSAQGRHDGPLAMKIRLIERHGIAAF